MLRLGSSKKSLLLSLKLNNSHVVLLRYQNLYCQNTWIFWKFSSTWKLFYNIRASTVGLVFFPIWLLRKRVSKKCLNPNKISSKLPCFVLRFQSHITWNYFYTLLYKTQKPQVPLRFFWSGSNPRNLITTRVRVRKTIFCQLAASGTPLPASEQ